MPVTPRKKKTKDSPAKMSKDTIAEPDDVDATSLLAEALGRTRMSPAAKPAVAPKATGMAPAEVTTNEDEFPLTTRRGGHDITEDNWAARSSRMAALARKNEVRAPGSTHNRTTHHKRPTVPHSRARDQCMFGFDAAGGRVGGQAANGRPYQEGAGQARTEHAGRGGGGSGGARECSGHVVRRVSV